MSELLLLKTPNSRGGRGQKSADNLAAEQCLMEEKAMSEKHKQEEEEARVNGKEEKAGTGSVRPKRQNK